MPSLVMWDKASMLPGANASMSCLTIAGGRAIDAAQAGDDALKAADASARLLGEDRADLGTVFGPTNVAIHRVAVPVELGMTSAASGHLNDVNVDRMPPLMAERRARHLIDVARCHTALGDHTAAFDTLLDAERSAPDEVRHHRLTQTVLADLLRHERRSSALRDLARRCQALP
ncbi:hypothetical protein LO762_07575 [Actinocorallia sp. API 0066]|uniref:hypothetical protein n=1 Tax=Actinocorallia sp. API 0066 TaxID=2896846 RepID=UPI001E5B7739|nr:hypothetical protein [Actinocorallia sp. API 0066]MCD0449048.1 hypothetical protein [Actinocorallia sp. API 0066]